MRGDLVRWKSLIPGDIIVSCPPMDTIKVSSKLRLTTQILAQTTIICPNGDSLHGDIIFPECPINKVFGPLWQVQQVTATGTLTGVYQKVNVLWICSITLKPEWTFGPLALPCKANGRCGPLEINMRFPFAWASFSGLGKWTVQAVDAYGRVK